MNKPRAISAQLVDIRNVGAHKSIKLTIHVPEEQARQVVELFGWPTMVDPVPVALARLEVMPAEQPKHGISTTDTTPGPLPDKPAGRAKREWHELQPSAQISIRCGETAFRIFLDETFPRSWGQDMEDMGLSQTEQAIRFVRRHCGVTSRADINSGNPQALDAWERLEWDYRAWQQAPAVGAA